MGRRSSNPREVRADGVTVRRTADTDRRLTFEPSDEAAPEEDMAAGCEGAEPEDYGVRVTWQSEAVRIEAAEFLVATRTEHEKRIRATHDLELRLHHDAEHR
jgi:hypothetical protein